MMNLNLKKDYTLEQIALALKVKPERIPLLDTIYKEHSPSIVTLTFAIRRYNLTAIEGQALLTFVGQQIMRNEFPPNKESSAN